MIEESRNLTEEELALEKDPELIARIEEARSNPKDRRSRPARVESSRD